MVCLNEKISVRLSPECLSIIEFLIKTYPGDYSNASDVIRSGVFVLKRYRLRGGVLNMGKDELSFKFDLKKNILKDRYRITEKGYKFDRFIFNFALISCFAFLFLIAFQYDFQLDFFECQASPFPFSGEKNDSIFTIYSNQEYCENPFYKESDWKNVKYLPAGKYGVDPKEWFWRTISSVLVTFLLAFSLNHIYHNFGVKNENNYNTKK